jgi:hypothetical protein
VLVLCATSFFVGLLLSGRMTILTSPPSGTRGASSSSSHGSRIALLSGDDCEHRRVSVTTLTPLSFHWSQAALCTVNPACFVSL